MHIILFEIYVYHVWYANVSKGKRWSIEKLHRYVWGALLVCYHIIIWFYVHFNLAHLLRHHYIMRVCCSIIILCVFLRTLCAFNIIHNIFFFVFRVFVIGHQRILGLGLQIRVSIGCFSCFFLLVLFL